MKALTVLAAALVSALAAGDVRAQAKQAAGSEDRTLTARDGQPIAITYYASAQGKESPVVILLHGKGSSRLVWKNGPFARLLQNKGYAVVAVDLRKHGESKPGGAGAAKKNVDLRPQDYARMVRYDLEAVKKFIYEEHQNQKLNMRKTAVIAPEMSAAVAIAWALHDWRKKPHPDGATLAARTPRGQDVQALVLVSPVENLPGLPAGRSLMDLRNIDVRSPAIDIAMLIAYGTGDSEGSEDANSIYKKYGNHPETKDHAELWGLNTRLRGMNLFGKFFTTADNKRVMIDGLIVNFLDRHLAKLTGEFYDWRDRKSRLK